MNINFCANENKYKPQNQMNFEVSSVYSAFLKPSQISDNSDIFVKKFDSLKYALDCLKELKFNSYDLKKIKDYGVSPIFKDGAEAMEFAKENNIQIVYEPVSCSDVHAQWDNFQNKIIINERYKNTKNLAEIYAISAAILHELSHAKDKDDKSSIQEEINCFCSEKV